MSNAIRGSSGAPFSRLLSVAGRRGSRVVDNAEMCTMIDSSDEWIQQRTGIIERRWIGEGEDIHSLAHDAADLAIQRAGVPRDDIDAVIVASVSTPRRFPSLAAELSYELGLTDAAAFDMQAACAGFCYATAQADAMIRCGTARHVLVIGADVLSTQVDITDRTTAFLFGDGAGAAVVGPAEEPGIGPVVWGSNGGQADVIWTEHWSDVLATGQRPVIHMAGSKVFLWATTLIADKAAEAIAKAGLTPDDLDVFIPHQANNRITDSMLRRLHLPSNVVVSRDIQHMGNSSAASIPLAMDALLSGGQAASGDNALIIGFGAGLVYAGQVVKLP